MNLVRRRYVAIVTFNDLMVTNYKFLWTRYTFSGVRFFYHGNTNLIIHIALIKFYNLHISIYRDYQDYLSLFCLYCLGLIADMNSLSYQVTIECMRNNNQRKEKKIKAQTSKKFYYISKLQMLLLILFIYFLLFIHLFFALFVLYLHFTQGDPSWKIFIKSL